LDLRYDGNRSVADTVSRRRAVGNQPVANVRRNVSDTEVHEETIEAGADDVWGFLTDPGALSAWFGADAWLELASGGPVRFRFPDGTERRGSVEEIVPGRRLTWRWRELHGAGLGLVIGEFSNVTIELIPLSRDATRVRIVERSLADRAVAPQERRSS
jgi:uncharacterized protein YndB with AHSA1/START domain